MRLLSMTSTRVSWSTDCNSMSGGLQVRPFRLLASGWFQTGAALKTLGGGTKGLPLIALRWQPILLASTGRVQKRLLVCRCNFWLHSKLLLPASAGHLEVCELQESGSVTWCDLQRLLGLPKKPLQCSVTHHEGGVDHSAAKFERHIPDLLLGDYHWWLSCQGACHCCWRSGQLLTWHGEH